MRFEAEQASRSLSAIAELLVTFAKKGVYCVIVVVCLSVSDFVQKLPNGTNEKNFGGDPHHRLDTGIVFRIRHYFNWAIREVVKAGSKLVRSWSATSFEPASVMEFGF